ncbi:MAG: peptidylprolyl isomerase [Methylophilaceae bacterium]|nr:peptidylprolyl isomerase [Methylophilaceae bacterium]MBL6726756.1 peptidylprolyl isomerase [Methylophilaceae bacterium]MBL6729010.1 peptidylprolyl isomerase [Methylophilaceae bacterium]MBL6791005.1 peptidylprolyl isomerase [Methylophilaceae bacterium]
MTKCKYLFIFCLFFSFPTFSEVAVVNNEKIEQRFVDFIKNEVEKQGRKVSNDMEENIIDRLIDLKVINQAAKRSGLLDDPKILTQAELSTQELIYTLYLQRYIVNNPVKNDEVKSEYEIFINNFDDREFKASHILLKTKTQAQKIIAKLEENDNFSTLAKESSIDESSKDNGGDLGWFEKRDMLEIIYDEVSKLKKGEFTKSPIQTQFGWHVIKLNDTREAPLPSFEDKKTELKTTLQKRKLKQHLDELRNQAKIKFK